MNLPLFRNILAVDSLHFHQRHPAQEGVRRTSGLFPEFHEYFPRIRKLRYRSSLSLSLSPFRFVEYLIDIKN